MSSMVRREHKCNNYNEALDIIKWMRRNFGDRGIDWDFSYLSSKNTLIVLLAKDRYIVEWDLVYG